MKIKNNLDKIIYTNLYDSMILGEYHMVDTLLITDIADKFEVSRTPAAQALSRLSIEGLLEKRSNGRFQIPNYTIKDIDDVCETRILFEQAAIRHIFSSKLLRNKVLSDLKIHQNNCASTIKTHDYLEFSREDLEFHRAIVQGMDNAVLSELFKNIQGRFVIANYLAFPLMERNFDKTIDEHNHIIEIFEKGSVEEAVSMIETHIYQVTQIVRERDQN